MAYRTYTTDALVVGSYDQLSADRTVILFTRELGLVYARAVSVRKEESKLRYGVQDFSLVRSSLVRGKYGWRMVGAEQSTSLYYTAEHRAARGALLRTVQLLRRLVRGEEAHPALFDMLCEGLRALATADEASSADLERILALRILAMLGYVAPHATYRELLEAETLTDAHARSGAHALQERMVRKAIDEALLVSQL